MKNEKVISEKPIEEKSDFLENSDEVSLLMSTILREYNFDYESKWVKAVQILNEDPRFRKIKNMKEAKHQFTEYISVLRSQQKTLMNTLKRDQKLAFRDMLDEYKMISIDTKYTSLLPIFYTDPRWTALDDKEREECFLEYMDILYKRQAEEEKAEISDQCRRLKKMFLETQSVSSITTWNEVGSIMRGNLIWEDLHDYYKLK